MLQGSKLTVQQTQSARNRRLGLILLSVAGVFFIGIVLKWSVLS